MRFIISLFSHFDEYEKKKSNQPLEEFYLTSQCKTHAYIGAEKPNK